MTLEQLQHLADAGVKIEISAADLLAVFDQIAGKQRKTVGIPTCPLDEAARLYGKNERTIRRWIADGVLWADKTGGVWSVETPQARYERINNKQYQTNN